MDIAIPLFDGITALDAIGPYEVLSRLPGARVRFVAVAAGPYRTDNRQLTYRGRAALGAARTPSAHGAGGFGTRAARGDEPAARLDPGRARDQPRGPRRSAPARCSSPRPAC